MLAQCHCRWRRNQRTYQSKSTVLYDYWRNFWYLECSLSWSIWLYLFNSEIECLQTFSAFIRSKYSCSHSVCWAYEEKYLSSSYFLEETCYHYKLFQRPCYRQIFWPIGMSILSFFKETKLCCSFESVSLFCLNCLSSRMVEAHWYSLFIIQTKTCHFLHLLTVC